jgi:hypothetical protein
MSVALGLFPAMSGLPSNSRIPQMGRKAVAKRMQGDCLAQPGGFCRLLEQPAELTRGHWLMLTAAWKQILCRRSGRKAATSSGVSNHKPV